MDSYNVPCGVFFILLIIGVILFVRQQNEASKRLREAHQNYRTSLDLLKQNPTNPDLRQRTLEWGRYYSNLTRNKKGVTIFDEVALSNDISAACAGAQSAIPASPPTGSPSIEDRLSRLKALLDSGAITEQEHRERRSKLLDEV